MNKILIMAKGSAKGGFNLFLGQVLSTIIAAVGSIIVARLLNPSDYGLIAIALTFPNTIALFRDLGINSAMVKYLAQYKSENNTMEIRNTLLSGSLLELSLGAVLCLISFSSAGFLASNVFRPDQPEVAQTLKSMIQVTSITIFAGSLLVTSQAVFTGFEKMKFYSLTMICQSSIKTFLATVLVLIGYGAFGAITGYTTASITAGILGITILYIIFYKKVRKLDNSKLNINGTIKKMLKYGLPLSFAGILGGLLTQFYNFMMIFYCSNFVIGNYKAAINFSVLLTFFTFPITTMLFPAFSKLNPEREPKNLRIVFQSSIKYASLLVVPITAAIMTLSKPLIFTLFGGRYQNAPLYLTLVAVSYLYTGLGSLSLGNFLNGQGKTTVTLRLTLITIAVGLPLSLVLTPRFGILGLIATILVAGIPSLVMGLWWVKEHYGFSVDWLSSTKIYLTSGTAAAITYIILFKLNTCSWMKLVTGGMIFIIIYLTMAPLIGAVNKTDLNNLREILGGIRPLYPLFNLPLKIVEKILNIKETG